MMNYRLDDDYQASVEKALTKAMIEASMSDDKTVCAVRSGEVCHALLNVFAFVAHTSDAVSTPTKQRKFCDEIAKRLYRRISLMREEKAAEAANMTTVHLDQAH